MGRNVLDVIPWVEFRGCNPMGAIPLLQFHGCNFIDAIPWVQFYEGIIPMAVKNQHTIIDDLIVLILRHHVKIATIIRLYLENDGIS